MYLHQAITAWWFSITKFLKVKPQVWQNFLDHFPSSWFSCDLINQMFLCAIFGITWKLAIGEPGYSFFSFKTQNLTARISMGNRCFVPRKPQPFQWWNQKTFWYFFWNRATAVEKLVFWLETHSSSFIHIWQTLVSRCFDNRCFVPSKPLTFKWLNQKTFWYFFWNRVIGVRKLVSWSETHSSSFIQIWQKLVK